MELSFSEVQLFKDEGHNALNEEYNLCLSDNSRRKLGDLHAGKLEFDIFAVFEALCDS